MEDAQLDKKVKVQHETQQGQSLEGNHPANPDLPQSSWMLILKPAQHQEGRELAAASRGCSLPGSDLPRSEVCGGGCDRAEHKAYAGLLSAV